MVNKLKILCMFLVLLFSSVTQVSGSSSGPSQEIGLRVKRLEHQFPESQSTYITGKQLSISSNNKTFLPVIFGPRIFFVSTQGNDHNPGTQAQPWRTIAKATRTLDLGQRVVILPGTYDEKVEISSSGITLQAQGKVITKAAYISGNSNKLIGFTITDPTSDWGIRTSGNYNLIEGNEIYHTKQDGIWFFGSYNTFRSNYIHDILDPSQGETHVDCFQTWGWDWDTIYVLFEKNLCVNNELRNYDNQIVMLDRNTSAEVRNITFRNNIFVIYNPVWAALNFLRASNAQEISNITVVNNTIVNMSRDRRAIAIGFKNITNATAINNLVINFGDEYTAYLSVTGSNNINIRNNAVYNTDGIPPKGPPYPGDIWMQNPQVMNLNDLDFHLQSYSPLINTGYALPDWVTSDIEGLPRPQGKAYDIGAYEFKVP